MSRLRSLLRSLFRKKQMESDLDAEVRSCLDTLTDEKMAAGCSPQEARRLALIEMGGAEQLKEKMREVRAGSFIDQRSQDLRYGLRTLRKSPGFTIVAMLTLALGIGVSTAIFSIVDTVMFRPLPYSDPDRLVAVYEGEDGRAVIAWSEFMEFARKGRYLDAIAAVQPVTATVLGGERPEQVSGALVSAALFPMLGVTPVIGRTFLPDEDRATAGQVALLSEGLWRGRYGADPDIVGKPVTLDVNESWGRPVQRAQTYTVVGVIPNSFQTLLHGTRGDVWLPLAPTPQASHDLFVVGRMKPDVTVAEVKSDLEAIAGPLRSTVHSDGREMRFRVVSVLQDLLGDWRRALLVLLGAVGFVLLIACVNVSNLLLARGRAREHEMAVRSALGAGRRRLAYQLITESLLLALISGVLASLVAAWGIRLIAGLSPEDLPRVSDATLDFRVFVFMGAVVLLAMILSGLFPALRLSSGAVFTGLRESGQGNGGRRGIQRVQSVLVVTEVSLAIVLLIGGVLMIRTMSGLLRVDPGFDGHDVLTLRFSLPRHSYETAGLRAVFFDKALPRIEALPGVQQVGVSHAIPFGGLFNGTQVREGVSGNPITAIWRAVSPGFFASLRIPIVKGRSLDRTDLRVPMQAAIVDETLAQRLWKDQDPVGQQIILAGVPPMIVAGVAGKIRDGNLGDEESPTVYLPNYPAAGALLIRSATDPTALVSSIRDILKETDPAVAPFDIQRMEDRVARSFSLQRFTTLLLGVFAGAALFLGVVGLYGVISFSVNQQTREIGVRMALGAQRGQVVRQVLVRGMAMVTVGMVFGVAAALVSTRLLTSLLFGIHATDPLTFVIVPAILAAVAGLACYLPARRAAGLDPASVLRHE
jgi:putative ABC transport system permease protein